MKLHNLTIKNFRSFDHFTLNNLGRVNLLVGTNNSGKTTVLEAVKILASDQKLPALSTVMARRGEFSSESKQTAFDIRCLFGGHQFDIDSQFWISGNTDLKESHVSVSIKLVRDLLENSPGFEQWLEDDQSNDSLATGASLVVQWNPERQANSNRSFTYAPLQEDGSVTSADIHARTRRPLGMSVASDILFIDAGSLSSVVIKELYERIVLTPQEDLVLESLKLVDNRIQRMASGTIGTDFSNKRGSRGILLRLVGVKDRVPIGSMGDGVWRMLGLALAVVHSQNSILLIDEIDTGLHHSVMDKMWRFLDKCSKRFNVQIIATTHSRDCYQSLAAICREKVVDQSEVTIQRIERGKTAAVAYSEAEIIAAANHDIEVR